MERKIVYFDKPGRVNTEETLRIAKARADELGIKSVLVASTDGNTAARAVDVFEGQQVAVVTHPYGIVGPNQVEFTEENRQKVLSKGGRIHTGSHAFIGLDEPMHYTYNQSFLGDFLCQTLSIFGSGIKVICEITCMAADAGLVRTDEDIIAIAGTHRGADTAAVLTPVNIYQLFDLDIKEILCKPYRRIKPPHKGKLPYEVYGPDPSENPAQGTDSGP